MFIKKLLMNRSRIFFEKVQFAIFEIIVIINIFKNISYLKSKFNYLFYFFLPNIFCFQYESFRYIFLYSPKVGIEFAKDPLKWILLKKYTTRCVCSFHGLKSQFFRYRVSILTHSKFYPIT